MRRGEFVVEDGEAVEGGGFGAEGVGAEGDGEDAGVLEQGEFGGGEVAFGADPDGEGGGGASVGLGEVTDRKARVGGVGGEAGDEAEVGGFGADEGGGGGEWGFDLGEPGEAALFGGFDEGGAPFFQFVGGVGFGGLGDGAFAADGDDAGGTEFGGFLQEEVEGFALEDGRAKGDGPRRARVGAAFADGEGDVAAGDGGDGAEEFVAAAVEDEDLLGGPDAEDGDGVMSLALGEGEGGLRGEFGWDEEAVHRVRLKTVV